MDEIIKKSITFAANINGTTFDEVMGNRRFMRPARAKRMCIALFVSYGMDMIDVADIFSISREHIRSSINRHEEEKRFDKSYKELYYQLRKEYERIIENGKNDNRN